MSQLGQVNQTLQGAIPAGNTPTSISTNFTYNNATEKAFVGIESFSTSVDSYSKGAHVSVEIRVSTIPQSIEDLAHTIASDYLKSRGINMTLDEIIDEYLPEHTV